MSSTISAGTTSGTAIAISGDTSGQLVLQTNGSTTAVTISTGQVVTLAQPLPVASGGSGVTTSTGTGANVLGTSPTLATPVLSGSVTGTYTLAGTPTMGASLITSGTAVASTSGTSIDFTGLPSWIRRVTVMFNGVSINGTAQLVAQIGGSSIETSGYLGNVTYMGASTASTLYTTYFIINPSSNPVDIVYGSVLTLSLLDASTNVWSASHIGTLNQSGGWYALAGGGTKTITGSLARLRITTSSGTATFDAGSVNIIYE